MHLDHIPLFEAMSSTRQISVRRMFLHESKQVRAKIACSRQIQYIRLSMFELRGAGDWDIFPGPPERARAETGGADQWVLKRRECSGLARVNQITSASLRYPLSVFNKNSTLKHLIFHSVVVTVEGEDADTPGYANLKGDRVRLRRQRSRIVCASPLARSR